MTKKNAIIILKELVIYKKKCVEIMDADSFSSDLEDVRVGLVKSAQRDQEIIQRVIDELQPGKVNKNMKSMCLLHKTTFLEKMNGLH